MRTCLWIIHIMVLGGIFYSDGHAQTCPINSLGQNPSTAFPVCGSNNFVQASVNLCGGRKISSPKCNSGLLEDINPYWYKFTCFKSGTLGFTITPNSNVSDYDWQVFDITGRNPDDVFTDSSLGIGSNWSQYYGNTGTTTTAVNLFECEGPVPQFSKMPELVAGRNYLLLVSHFSNSQAGYRLDFGGGTASITDTTQPKLAALTAHCNGKSLTVKLNKKMKCGSLALNGTDFVLSPAVATITAARGANCSTGFDTDSLILTLSDALPAGTFELVAQKGTDNNTLLDICDKPLADGEKLGVTILPAQPSLMDSIAPVGCKPGTLEFYFRDPILCSSIAANGSDFVLNGPETIGITGAAGTCTNGETTVIRVQLARPIQVGGLYNLQLKTGSDGNTLLNACGLENPFGESLEFNAYDTVLSAFSYVLSGNCDQDTLYLKYAGNSRVSSYRWTLDDGSIQTGDQVTRVYTSGSKTIHLRVSNGVCADSSSVTINFDRTRVKAAFSAPAFICPLDTAKFTDQSTGPVISWLWDFGNGQTSTLKQPPLQNYATQAQLQVFTARLTVTAANGCADFTTQQIQVPNNCYIAVPTGFTPNGDGLNDYLYPLSAYKATNLEFKVYNRYGQLVWQTTDWTHKWDGTLNGRPQDSGTYVWHLSYTDDKGKNIKLKGTTNLIR